MPLKAYRITGYYQPITGSYQPNNKPRVRPATPLDFVILSEDIGNDIADIMEQYRKAHQYALLWYDEIRKFKS
jgi:hypothetical protein